MEKNITKINKNGVMFVLLTIFAIVYNKNYCLNKRNYQLYCLLFI